MCFEPVLSRRYLRSAQCRKHMHSRRRQYGDFPAPFGIAFNGFNLLMKRCSRVFDQGWKPGVCHRQVGKSSYSGSRPHEVWCDLWCDQDILGCRWSRKEGRGLGSSGQRCSESRFKNSRTVQVIFPRSFRPGAIVKKGIRCGIFKSRTCIESRLLSHPEMMAQ